MPQWLGTLDDNSFGGTLLKEMDKQKQTKQAMLLQMINSGQYQPMQQGQQPPGMGGLKGLLGSVAQGMTGPQLGPTANMAGMNFQQVTPEMKSAQMQKQMAMMGLGAQPGASQVSSPNQLEKEMIFDPMSGDMKMTFKQKPQDQGMGGVNDVANKTPEMLQAEIKEKNPAYGKYLQSLAEGKFTLGGRSTKQIAKIQQDLANLYPGMDQSKINARYKTRQDFTTGKSAQNIKSLNTATQHLAELNKIIPELHNVKFPMVGKMWNSAKNMGMSQSGDPTISRFKAIKNALSGELANIYKISGGTDTEIKHVGDTIDMSDSPEGLKASVEEAITLMGGRLSALQDQWHNAFDMPNDTDFPVISPKSKSTLSSIGYDNENNTVKNTGGESSNNDYQKYLQAIGQ